MAAWRSRPLLLSGVESLSSGVGGATWLWARSGLPGDGRSQPQEFLRDPAPLSRHATHGLDGGMPGPAARLRGAQVELIHRAASPGIRPFADWA